MPEWLYFILGFVVLVVAGTVLLGIRIRRIAASRPGEGFETFCSSFDTGEVSNDVLRSVFARFQEWVGEFPVRAEDKIGDIYGMADEDLDDAIFRSLEECGRAVPTEEQLCELRPVVTVRDFVLFISECPKPLEPQHAIYRRQAG